MIVVGLGSHYQLIGITITNQSSTGFIYDGKMRMRVRYESNWVSSAWVKAGETRYIYDGMLPIQERDAYNIPLVTYIRGDDLSGTHDGAGGIGGLLARVDHTTITPAYACYHSDGNGNVTMLVDEHEQIATKYIYEPFGDTVSMSGRLAEANTMRFSSKEAHDRSGLYYYGYRFYAPKYSRWLNRDPLSNVPKLFTQFRGHTVPLSPWEAHYRPNLCLFSENGPTYLIDPDGLWAFQVGVSFSF